ncbi:hypothetical protein GCM10010361_11440 [Streptomyces olivaceiscleroticus]|uniref:Uncharacterized protein n=1 Tax=Streptomyces olivaceiscleroticus TaxID=68245 RepID=A0ABN0ZIK2_9ACTN
MGRMRGEVRGAWLPGGEGEGAHASGLVGALQQPPAEACVAPIPPATRQRLRTASRVAQAVALSVETASGHAYNRIRAICSNFDLPIS